MSRLIVMTDSETALGFRLAGADVITVEDAATARVRLLELLGDPMIGLIAVRAGMIERLDDGLRRRIAASTRPIVVSLPAGDQSAADSRRGQLAALLRSAIGFDIMFAEADKEP
jgi:V/A-type H+/Na+-transporting ATPase subunit F